MPGPFGLEEPDGTASQAMNEYISHFLSGPEQVLSLAVVGVLWTGFTAIGAAMGGAMGGSGRLREVDHLSGWATVALAFTFWGVFVRAPFVYVAVIAAAAAIWATVQVIRRDGRLFPDGLGRVLLLALPLFVLVSAMRGSQWDEFSQWLTVIRHMLAVDVFPDAEHPYHGVTFAGYPFTWNYVSYLASRLAGGLLENASALSNLVLLFGFALLVRRIALRALGSDGRASGIGWPAAALAALAVTLLNPTFVQKVVLTAYADTSTAVVTGTAVVLGWLVIEELLDADEAAARRLALQCGLVLAIVISLKQATLVLVVIFLIAFAMVALRQPGLRVARLAVLLGLMIGPPLLIYLAWRYHVTTRLAASEFALQPFAQWHLALIPDILWKMLTVIAKKGYYLGLCVIIVALGARGFFRARTPLDRLAALGGLVILGYNAFLLFAYVAAFGEYDALRAASYWRYNMHLGLVVVAVAAYGLAVAWREKREKLAFMGRLGWLPVVLIVAAPFVFAHKLRFDKAPETAHFRLVGAAASKLLDAGDRVYVVDPTGSGESGVITAYELTGGAKYVGYVSAFFGDKEGALKGSLVNQRPSALIVHSMIPGFRGILGQPLEDGRS